jgi:hypothetical protein
VRFGRAFTTEEGLLLPVFAVDHPLDSIFQVKDVEVDQETDTDSAETHVGEKLGFMDGMDRVHSFHFDYDSGFYQVDSVSDFELLSLIDNRQRDL